MLNLLGDLWENKSLDLNFGNNKDIFLHLYNKTIAKKGRKMGHFTVVDKFLNSANVKADKLYNSLKNEKL
jgi:5-(carboxyamino)imidazole ribonucleotide synthase